MVSHSLMQGIDFCIREGRNQHVKPQLIHLERLRSEFSMRSISDVLLTKSLK